MLRYEQLEHVTSLSRGKLGGHVGECGGAACVCKAVLAAVIVCG